MNRIIALATRDWGLKLMALVLAFLLWTVVRAEGELERVIPDVPINVQNADPDWILVGPPQPATTSIVVSGPWGELWGIALGRQDILVLIDEVQDSVVAVTLNPGMVRLNGSTQIESVNELRPSSVRLRFERAVERFVPVAVELAGSPVPGFEVTGPVRLIPDVVLAKGATSRVTRPDTIRLQPIDLSGRSFTDTLHVAIDTTGFGFTVAPEQIQVVVPIALIADTTAQGTGGDAQQGRGGSAEQGRGGGAPDQGRGGGRKP